MRCDSASPGTQTWGGPEASSGHGSLCPPGALEMSPWDQAVNPFPVRGPHSKGTQLYPWH